jgi:hypothetical protein
VATLERVMGRPLAEVRAAYHPLDANYVFFAPSFRVWLTPEEKRAVDRLYLRTLLLRHPHVFVSDRSGISVNAVWSPLYTCFDHLGGEPQVFRNQLGRTAWGIAPEPPWPEAGRATRAVLDRADRRKELWWNSGFALALLLAALAAYPRYPASALFAAAVLAQVPVIFASIPMAYFKYVHFVYAAPFVLIPLWLAERRAATR